MDTKNTEEVVHRKGTGLWNIIKSTLAAASGVQTKANRERDFKQGKPITFVIAGLVFVTLFILGMYGIVQLVMSIAAPSV